jgi:hypothetical protein
VKTIQAYRFALDLTPSQQRAVLAHAGAARVAHNWALARVKAVMDQRAAERSYGIPDEQLTESLPWSLPALRKAWNAAKAEVAPVVDRVLERGVQHRSGRPRAGIEELGRRPYREACRPTGRVPPVQVPPPHDAVRTVHHRHDPGRAGPRTCRAAPAGPSEAARVRPQAGPPPGRGHCPDHVCHRAP